MAVYEYACMECDITQEKERSIHDSEPEYFCESCGYALTRVFSPFGLSFKGGGFYSTDGRNVQLQLGSITAGVGASVGTEATSSAVGAGAAGAATTGAATAGAIEPSAAETVKSAPC